MKQSLRPNERPIASLAVLAIAVVGIGALVIPNVTATTYTKGESEDTKEEKGFFSDKPEAPVFNEEAYDKKMRFLAHIDETATTSTSTPKQLWPVTDTP